MKSVSISMRRAVLYEESEKLKLALNTCPVHTFKRGRFLYFFADKCRVLKDVCGKMTGFEKYYKTTKWPASKIRLAKFLYLLDISDGDLPTITHVHLFEPMK